MPLTTPICLDGEYWTITWVRSLPKEKDGREVHGKCRYRSKKILIATKFSEREILDTLCHELVHATDPELTEDAVVRRGNNYSHALWEAGYRRTTEDQRTTLGIE